jgi:RNA polymerase sigma factor (sigma-70 family)
MSEDVKVCVVDDDEGVRNAISRLLKAAGYRACTYPSAQAFLSEPRPADAVPTVVLTDLRMPGIDGIALAEQLACEPVPPPVVFLSAHGDVPATVRAMKDGAIDFLEKPVCEDALFEALERAVARSREQIVLLQGLRVLQDKLARLTPRERQVFALVVSGLINKEAAWELGISEKTIKVHRARVVEKMGARSLPDLVRMAERLGIPLDAGIPRATQPQATG